MQKSDIYSWIKSEENSYETEEVQLGDNWYWSMRNHVQLIFHLMNSVFYTGENNWIRAFKQIMKPIIQLANWTEDIEVKDTVFYIKGDKGKALSFLIKKYHDDVYTKEHDLDKLYDDITEMDNAFGGVLVQKGDKSPEVLPFQSIAFCDQTDILASPIGFKFNFSPSKLKSMEKNGWGNPSNGATITIDELITLADNDKEASGIQDGGKENKTTGKTIEVYIIKGDMPTHYLKDDDDMETTIPQVQIVAFYTDKDSKKQGVTLYRQKDNDTLKFFSSTPIFQRALGGSVGEDMLYPQIFTNFATIHKTNFLEAASKVPLYTDDGSFKTRNKIQDMENLEITTVEENKRIYQIPTASPANIQVLQNSVDEWLNHGQLLGSAFDPILGKEATSGTTFRGQERTVAQGRGSHDRKRGKRAKFIEEIYRDWIIPSIVKEIVKGKEFIADLPMDEFNWLVDTLATNATNKKIKEKMMDGEVVTREEQEQILSMEKEIVKKKGNRQLLEIVKDEFKGIEIELGINVANKQKNLADLSDKVLSIFQFIFANPQAFQQAMQNKGLAKAFSDILEFSGLSMGDFSSLMDAPPVQQIPEETGQTPSLEGLVAQQNQNA